MAGRKRARLSKLHLAAHLAALLPLAWLAWDAYANNLSANPIQAATQRTGLYALVLLLASLSCTPIHLMTRYAPVLRLRRPLGLYAFFYAALHVLIFIGLDYGFAWEWLLADLSEKRYIFAGLGAFLILLALAATSSDAAKLRLRKRWRPLHRLAYLAAGLAVLHFLWVVKGSVSTLQGEIVPPLIAALILSALLMIRVPAVRRRLPFRLHWSGKKLGQQELN